MNLSSLWIRTAQAQTSSYATEIGVAVIVTLAVCVAIAFTWQLRPIVRDLRRARDVVERAPKDVASFAAEFHTIKQALSENPTLGHAWGEFNEVLIPEGWSGNSRIRNAQPPGDYLHRASVTTGRINLRLFNTFPNILIGLAIPGAFGGLVAGISLASHGLGLDDPERCRLPGSNY